MRHQLRNSDCPARLGGDEFGLILFDCRLEQAKSLMQQVVNQISQHPFYWEGKIYRVGASAGITRIGGDAKSSELLAGPTSPATPPSTTAAAGFICTKRGKTAAGTAA